MLLVSVCVQHYVINVCVALRGLEAQRVLSTVDLEQLAVGRCPLLGRVCVCVLAICRQNGKCSMSAL